MHDLAHCEEAWLSPLPYVAILTTLLPWHQERSCQVLDFQLKLHCLNAFHKIQNHLYDLQNEECLRLAKPFHWLFLALGVHNAKWIVQRQQRQVSCQPSDSAKTNAYSGIPYVTYTHIMHTCCRGPLVRNIRATLGMPRDSAHISNHCKPNRLWNNGLSPPTHLSNWGRAGKKSGRLLDDVEPCTLKPERFDDLLIPCQ